MYQRGRSSAGTEKLKETDWFSAALGHANDLRYLGLER
jgi:hypothetical protein